MLVGVLPVMLCSVSVAVRLPLRGLDLLSINLLHAGLLGLVTQGVLLLSLDAPDVRLLNLVHLRFTVLGLALALVSGGLLQLGGFLVGALEGAGILEGVGVLGVVVVVAVAGVGVVVATVAWVAVAASVAGLVHGCFASGG
jgi:hypothetical protein